MREHTPGPWMKTTENNGAIPEHFRPVVVTNHGGDRVVARLPDGWSEEDRANAVLIAAAPDLLAAIKDLLGDRGSVHGGICLHCGRDYRGDPDVPDESLCPEEDCPSSIARAAIAKAEGRTA